MLADLIAKQPNTIQAYRLLAEVKLEEEDWTGAQAVADALRRVTNEGGEADLIAARRWKA